MMQKARTSHRQKRSSREKRSFTQILHNCAVHYLKLIPLTFAALYAIFALWVLGTKYTYEHPRLIPEIHVGGKVDDWQYDPVSSRTKYRSPWENFTDAHNVATNYKQYLASGFLLAVFFMVYLLITLTLSRNIYRGIVIWHHSHGNKDLRRLGQAKIAIALPILVVILLVTIEYLAEEIFYPNEFWGLLAKGLKIAVPLIVGVDVCYLLISGLMNWGSERPEVKKIGKRKVLCACVSVVVSYLLIVASHMIIDPHIQLVYSNIAPDTMLGGMMNSSDTALISAGVSTNSISLENVHLNSLTTSKVGSTMTLDTFDSFESDDTIGLAVGGANDVDNFRENIKNNYLPEPTDITYEGLFYDYYFDTGATKACNKLFCPSYTAAISPDPYTGEDQYYLSVGLNSGIKESDFARKPLNLMVVMDISGSMDASFDDYYYDGNRAGDDDRSKMEIANETLVNLMSHLQDEDRFGVVLFDHQAYLAKPFRKVKDTDMTAIQKHVLDIQAQGGTNMSAGIQEAVQQFATLDLQNPDYDNRVIFITDAMPNQGETSEKGLFGQIRSLSLDRVYTTFIGVGVDLNTQLVGGLTKTRGANYYSVHSALDFKRRLADEFEYMVTPLVFDLTLSVDAPGYEIMQVYGSPEADQATGKIMAVNTLYPSASSGGENKGGLVLLQLRRRPGATNDQIRLRTTYEDRQGVRDGSEEVVNFAGESGIYPNTGIRKGIALTRYASVIKDWLLASRYSDQLIYTQDKVKIANMGPIGAEYYQTNGIRPTGWPVKDGRWERGSRPLSVSSDYVSVFQTLRDYLDEEIAAIGDDSLRQEVDILDLLIAMGTTNPQEITTQSPSAGNKKAAQ